MNRIHPRTLKGKPRSWTPEAIALLRSLATAGLSKKRAAQMMRMGYEALRSAAEVHSVAFLQDKPGRPRKPFVQLPTETHILLPTATAPVAVMVVRPRIAPLRLDENATLLTLLFQHHPVAA